ncbi:MAG: hypothetical protein EBV89_07195 [Betaproteobacteria bacterium]|nr:hypothetical protein [Betaproteobacteria bacterium]
MEQAMSKPFKLSELDQFIGTQRYYRMSSRVVLTDGTHYLAERVGCYWWDGEDWVLMLPSEY